MGRRITSKREQNLIAAVKVKQQKHEVLSGAAVNPWDNAWRDV